MLWEALALEGFGKLLKSLGGFGRLWLEHSMSLTEALGGVGKFWEPLGSFGRVWEPLGGFRRLWYASEGFGRFWKALECFGRLLGGFWMFWDALEGWQPGFGPMDALEGFGGFRSLAEVCTAFGWFFPVRA